MADFIRYKPTTWPRWLAERLLADEFGDGDPTAREGGTWPPVDVYHDASTFFVRVELPGVEGKGVNVRVQGPHLIVEGERKRPEGFSFHQIESAWGEFSRIIHLPETVDTEKIDTRLEHGVLTVSFPIQDAVKPKSIHVKAG